LNEIEIKSLVEKANKSIETAEIALKRGDFDSSVSRTYYAMFYVVEALLLSKNIKTKTHKGLISSFSLLFIKKGLFSQDMGRKLNKALDKRLMGDYEFVSVNEKETEDLLKMGKDFIHQIIQFLINAKNL